MSYETTRSHLLPGAAAKFCYVDTADYETDWHAHDQYMFILPRSGDLSISTESSKAPLQVARAQLRTCSVGDLPFDESEPMPASASFRLRGWRFRNNIARAKPAAR